MEVAIDLAAQWAAEIPIRVTDGARTRDIKDHNLALCQLSYGHRPSLFLSNP